MWVRIPSCSLVCARVRLGLECTFNAPRKQREFDSPRAHFRAVDSRMGLPQTLNLFLRENVFDSRTAQKLSS